MLDAVTVMMSYISAMLLEAIAHRQEFTAIVVLTNTIDKPSMARLAANESTRLTTDNESTLRSFIAQMAKDVASWREDKRVTASREQLLALLKGFVPRHPSKEIRIGTFHSIIKKLGIRLK
jgi:hypothetical protein